MRDGADHLRCSGRLREAMAPHVAALPGGDLSAALDLAANTRRRRASMRGLIEASCAAHRLHARDMPEAERLARLRARYAAGDHPFAADETQFHAFSRHFTPPAPEEGFAPLRDAPPPAALGMPVCKPGLHR